MMPFDEGPDLLPIDSKKSGSILSVAIPRPLEGLFTYRLPAELVPLVQVGGCVKVPFGKSITHAFIVEPPKDIATIPEALSVALSGVKLKDVLAVNPMGEVLPPDVMKLCHWAREYYCAPLGEVLNCAIPLSLLEESQTTSKTTRKTSLAKKASKKVAPRIVQFTDEQSQALKLIQQFQEEGSTRVALLNGVTGSGKTEVYIELARNALAAGRGVLILVPEIALTPQLYQRFEEQLGVSIAVWHSAISPGRRRQQNLALRTGETRIVIGARSAVFAPVQNLGLVVVDEEHDATYKQEDRVRYNARDLAIVRAMFASAFTVLGSATPSLETRERVREGRYSQAKLTRRIAPGGFPPIEMIDLRTEEKVQDVQALLSLRVVKKIQATLDAGEQVMVYLNRRGFAAFLLCRECGEVKNCTNCSVSLTVHRKDAHLRCHICGYIEQIPDTCNKCHGTDLFPMGAGTESLEVDLSRLLRGAKILRLDRDQITSAKRLDQILEKFRNKEGNILLGTQMLVKGHDFPGVTLVVVVLADSLFRFPDFRSPERAYQILRQVSGRSGRGDQAGRVLIQTFDTEHPVLQALDGRLSEETFLENERELRQCLGYPPFGRLARLRFESNINNEAATRASFVAQQLNSQNNLPNLEFLGPSEAFLERVKGSFRWDLLIKSKSFPALQKAIGLARQLCFSNKWQMSVDVDPYSI